MEDLSLAMRRLCRGLAVGALALCVGVPVPSLAASLSASTFTAIKAPECIADPTTAFFSENVAPVIPPHPSLPSEHFYSIARYLGDDAIAAAPSFDYSRFPSDYPWPPARGVAITGFSPPDPKAIWQRAHSFAATMDSSSALQIYCRDAGSFINTWTFPAQTITGGGAHTIYGYSFNNPPPPPIYDASPGTDFVLQAGIEIPWFIDWPDTSPAAQSVPVGQVSLFTYLREHQSAKLFAILIDIYDSRAAAVDSYTPFIAHDTATPFASTSLGGDPRYVSRSPYSSGFTGAAWTGLRFFRGHISQAQFRNIVADINAYCRAHAIARFCNPDPTTGVAFSDDPTSYEMTDFGVLHEVFRGGPNGNLSMGMHVYELGAWNAR